MTNEQASAGPTVDPRDGFARGLSVQSDAAVLYSRFKLAFILRKAGFFSALECFDGGPTAEMARFDAESLYGRHFFCFTMTSRYGGNLSSSSKKWSSAVTCPRNARDKWVTTSISTSSMRVYTTAMVCGASRSRPVSRVIRRSFA